MIHSITISEGEESRWGKLGRRSEEETQPASPQKAADESWPELPGNCARCRAWQGRNACQTRRAMQQVTDAPRQPSHKCPRAKYINLPEPCLVCSGQNISNSPSEEKRLDKDNKWFLSTPSSFCSLWLCRRRRRSHLRSQPARYL